MKMYSIRQHVAWLTLTPLLILAASLELFFLHDRFSALDHDLAERGKLIARQLATDSEYGVFSNNRDFLQNLAQGVLQQTDARGVLVLDASSNPLAEAGKFSGVPEEAAAHANTGASQPARIGKILEPVNLQTPVFRNGEVRIYQPIVSAQIALDVPGSAGKARQVGAVIIEMSNARTEQHKSRMLRLTVGSTVLFLIFPIGLIYLSSRKTVSSILGLSKAIRTLGDGRLETRVSISAPVTELDALAGGINEMAAKLQREDTVLRQRTASLAEANRQIAAIFDATADGILVADAESRRFVNGNRSICDMLGYRLEELAGLTVNDIHPPESLAHVLDQFERQARGEIRVAADLPVKRKDGSVFYADISTAAAILEERNCLVGIFHDVTARKQAEAAIRRLNEELEAKVAARTADLEHAMLVYKPINYGT